MSLEHLNVFYPRYFNSQAKKKQGRRVSLSRAVPWPTVAEIQQMLQKLQISADIDERARYPRSTVDDTELGCLRFHRGAATKEQLLRQVGALLVEHRKATYAQTQAAQGQQRPKKGPSGAKK